MTISHSQKQLKRWEKTVHSLCRFWNKIFFSMLLNDNLTQLQAERGDRQMRSWSFGLKVSGGLRSYFLEMGKMEQSDPNRSHQIMFSGVIKIIAGRKISWKHTILRSIPQFWPPCNWQFNKIHQHTEIRLLYDILSFKIYYITNKWILYNQIKLCQVH